MGGRQDASIPLSTPPSRPPHSSVLGSTFTSMITAINMAFTKQPERCSQKHRYYLPTLHPQSTLNKASYLSASHLFLLLSPSHGASLRWWNVFWDLFTARDSGQGTEDAMIYTEVLVCPPAPFRHLPNPTMSPVPDTTGRLRVGFQTPRSPNFSSKLHVNWYAHA